MRIAAVVVTYNRLNDLKVCLSALRVQSRLPDEIIVVDNASTDETASYLQQNVLPVTVHRSNTNLGGAGGFALGIDLAISSNHDWAWVMDDDAVPKTDALLELVRALDSLDPQAPGFLTSTVVNQEGIRQPDHVSAVPSVIDNHGFVGSGGIEMAAYATFVGALINLHVARKTWLPVGQFFLWWDDTEYTSRLQRLAGGLRVVSSEIVHPSRNFESDLGVRYKYDLRNRIWLLRDPRLGSKYSRRRARGRIFLIFRRQLRHTPTKRKLAFQVLGSVYEGVFMPVRLRRPGS